MTYKEVRCDFCGGAVRVVLAEHLVAPGESDTPCRGSGTTRFMPKDESP